MNIEYFFFIVSNDCTSHWSFLDFLHFFLSSFFLSSLLPHHTHTREWWLEERLGGGVSLLIRAPSSTISLSLTVATTETTQTYTNMKRKLNVPDMQIVLIFMCKKKPGRKEENNHDICSLIICGLPSCLWWMLSGKMLPFGGIFFCFVFHFPSFLEKSLAW